MSIAPQHPAYMIDGPVPPTIPLVVDSPHSWRHYPEDFHPVARKEDLLTSWDAYVEELFGATPLLGGVLLAARFPRFYIDVNRRRDDIDPDLLSEPWPEPVAPTDKSAVGMGLLRRLALPDTPVYGRPLRPDELRRRIEQCYDPYVAALEDLVDLTAGRFGHVLHLDCHSMKSRGNAMNTDAGRTRPDIVVSDQDGRTADGALTRHIAGLIADFGYHVAINDPYKGGDLVARTGRPAANRHSVQIEINRALYMDEASFQKSSHFDKVRSDLAQVIERLGASLHHILGATEGAA
jgi:N-formylglutamate deformylase